MKRIAKKKLYEGQWLSLHEEIFVNKHGQEIRWEIVRRNNQEEIIGIVLARLVPSGKIILIKQFRPALNDYILGVPIGMIDGDGKGALRELKEETGYAGKIISQSPVLSANAGLTSDECRMFCVEVDESLPANKNPQQHLEPTEDIEVITVPQEKIIPFLIAQQKKGVHISSGLWYMFGIQDFLRKK